MGAKEFSRTRRIAEQVRRELADILTRESNDPRFARLTISGVEVSKDLSHAKVYVTPTQGTDVRGLLQALNKAAGYLRRELSHRTRSRGTPSLRFVHDKTLESALRVTELIDSAIASHRPVDRPDEE